MPRTPTRRQFLAAAGASATTASAGCLGLLPSGGRGGASGSRSLHLDLTRRDGPLRDRYVVDLEETRSERDEEAFAAVLDGERYTTQHVKPFFSTGEDPVYARRDGTYYLLGSVVVDEAEATHPVLRLYEVENENGADGLPADRLPELDRRAVHVAHMAARARGNSGGVPWGLVQRGGYVYRRAEATDGSRLLGDDPPDRVVFRETTYDVSVSRETFFEPVYRATVEPVATDPERMEAILHATFVDARLSRDDLSTEARSVLRDARRGGYAGTHPYSAGFREVLIGLHERAYLDGNVEKDAFGRERRARMALIDDAYYDYHLRFEAEVE